MKIMLCGGPVDLALRERIKEHDSLPRVIKIRFRGGYERFEPSGDVDHHDGEPVSLFRWVYRTEIGE